MKKLLFLSSALGMGLTLHAQLGYIEEGYATYYSDKFHGRRTASGIRYDKDAFTCAHKQLPFGTRVRIVNLDTHKEVIVEVTDRGPYGPGRIVDLSKSAARKLGLLQAGMSKVRLEVVGVPHNRNEATSASADKAKPQLPEKPAVPKSANPKPESPKAGTSINPGSESPKPAASALAHIPPAMLKVPGTYHISGKKANPKGWGIQLGAFRTMENVESLCRQIMDAGYRNIHIVVAVDPSSSPSPPLPSPPNFVYRVILGVYPEENIPKNLEEIEKKGLSGGFKYKFM
jgi:rare lipoprotein A